MRKGYFFIIPAVVLGICAGIYFSGIYSSLNERLFRLVEYLNPPAEAEQRVFYVGIGKPYPPVERIGAGLSVMGELGTELIVLTDDFSGSAAPGGEAALSDAMKLFGNVIIPMHAEKPQGIENPGGAEAFLRTFTPAGLEVREEFPFSIPGYTRPDESLLEAARGGGFILGRDRPAEDGLKLALIRRYSGAYYPHLMFSALLSWMQSPSIFLYKDRAVLQNAFIPGGEMKDIVIPFSESGEMYLRGEMSRTLSLSPFIRQEDNIRELYTLIVSLERSGLLSEETGGKGLAEIYRAADSLKRELIAGSSEESPENWAALRERFLREAGAFFSGDAETIIGEEQNDLENLFARGRKLHKDTVEEREELRKRVAGGMGILGYGEVPSETPAGYGKAVYTVLNEDFVDDFPWWYSLAGAAVLAFLLMFILTRFKPLAAVLAGLPITAVFAGLPVIPFYFFSMYIPLFFPIAAAAAVYLSAIVVQTAFYAREKRDIFLKFRDTVPASKMGDVVSMYAAEGEQSGVRLPMSVLYVRVGDLPSILHREKPDTVMQMYETFASLVRETVLSMDGLLGAVDGAKAWAVWGAFSEDASDALEACKAALALRSRAGEAGFSLLCTLAAGEGIRGKKVTLQDTAMPLAGIPVLQGEKLLSAHSLFGADILVTGKIHSETAAQFTYRRLDKIRISGFSEAVRLYELVDVPENGDSYRNFLELYAKAHELFEKKEWVQAHHAFIEAIKMNGGDAASELYARRCQKFLKSPPSASWDGTFSIN